MGDPRRFTVLAAFIARNFLPGRVADVAGGMGLLSYELAQRGFTCTVIDPRPSGLPGRRVRRDARRQRLPITYRRERFTPDLATGFDLVVGLHPDGATEAICRAARTTPVVLVPCCRFWQGIESHGAGDMAATVRRALIRAGVEWWETTLPMTGKNLVFVVRPRGGIA